MLRSASNARDRLTDAEVPNGRAGAGEVDPFQIRTDGQGDADPAGAGSQDSCQQSMAMLIADEIIPRLIAAHRNGQGPLRQSIDAEQLLVALDPGRLANEAVSTETSRLLEIAEAAIAAGLGFEALLVDVMAPAARILGERWEKDETDFVEVTLGLWRMQELVHLLAVSHHLPAHAYDNLAERRVLCAVGPGDEHSLGSVMLEEVFRRAGWSPSGARNLDRRNLLAAVKAESFDLIALTLSVERNSAVITDLISALRTASRNPGVKIMVGGPVFNEQPGLADVVGADATASDARAALHKAEMLVGHLLVGQADAKSGRNRREPYRPGLQPD